MPVNEYENHRQQSLELNIAERGICISGMAVETSFTLTNKFPPWGVERDVLDVSLL